jgi:hypothetical protein
MALCKLTRNWGDRGQAVYINPVQVVSVDGDDTNTWITTCAHTESAPHTIYVVEKVEEVVRLLDAHMPRLS